MIESFERPTFEARCRIRAAAILNGIAAFIWAITGRPLEKLSLWMVPDTLHCPACWRWQRIAKDGAITVNHKRGCDYVRLCQNEDAWQEPAGVAK